MTSLINKSTLKGDFFGGITAGIVALPLALAFGAQTELGAIAGLYGAIALGVLAALFGGTQTQISGPTGPMTVVSAVVILEAIEYAGSAEAAMPIILGIFFIAGLFEALLGVFRVGRYIRYIPYPVVSGFMSGIGLIIIISQIFPFFGAEPPAGGSIGVVRVLGTIPSIFNPFSVVLATLTIAIIYLFPRLTKAVPGNLVALVLLSLGAYLLLNNGQVSVINDSTPGGVPTGLPKLHLDFWKVFTDPEHLLVIFEYAFTLGALGAIDSLLTSIVADNLTRTQHDSNRELIGQGIGNMAAAMIAGLPGAGATMRTVVNIKAGGKTRLSGVIAGLLLLAILLGLGPLVGNIPNAVLAGILITVGIGIIDYRGMSHLREIPRADAAVLIVVLLLTVFVGLLEAVAIGMVMAAILFMKNIADVTEEVTSSAPIASFAHEIPWADEVELQEKIGDKVFIKHLNGSLFFGFTAHFQDMFKAMSPHVQVVLIRMGRVNYIDQSGLIALDDAISELTEKGIIVAFTGLHGQPKDMLERIKLVPGLVPEGYNFRTFDDGVAWLEGFLRGNNYFRENKVAGI